MNLGDKYIAQYMGEKYRLPVHLEVRYEFKPIAKGEKVKKVNGEVVKSIIVERYEEMHEGHNSWRGLIREKKDVIIHPITGVYKFYYGDPQETDEYRENTVRENVAVNHWLNFYEKEYGVPFEFVIKEHKRLK